MLIYLLYVHAHVEVSPQLSGVHSLLPLCGGVPGIKLGSSGLTVSDFIL